MRVRVFAVASICLRSDREREAFDLLIIPRGGEFTFMLLAWILLIPVHRARKIYEKFRGRILRSFSSSMVKILPQSAHFIPGSLRSSVPYLHEGQSINLASEAR